MNELSGIKFLLKLLMAIGFLLALSGYLIAFNFNTSPRLLDNLKYIGLLIFSVVCFIKACSEIYTVAKDQYEFIRIAKQDSREKTKLIEKQNNELTLLRGMKPETPTTFKTPGSIRYTFGMKLARGFYEVTFRDRLTKSTHYWDGGTWAGIKQCLVIDITNIKPVPHPQIKKDKG
jgi:hypothetical protein